MDSGRMVDYQALGEEICSEADETGPRELTVVLHKALLLCASVQLN